MSARSTASRPQTPTLESVNSTKAPDNGAKENIKVSVRIRPLSEKESSRGDRAVWGTDGSGGVGLLSASGSRLDVKFAYDAVFSAGNDNEQVFNEVAWPAIEPVLQGISGTVFAYGVTSSGKTHTMMGTPTDAGVVPRAIQALFARISRAEDSVYTVKLSMMEVYCEMLNDLLDRSKLNLDVQECAGGAGKGPVLLVKGLTEGQMATAEEALALIQQGQENRKVASTAFNDQSSRSHTICRFLIESSPRHSSSNAPSALHTATCSSRRDSTTGVPGSSAAANGSSGSSNVSCTRAWLTLVDLAGSEGAKAALSKDQQAEARDINRSLLTLGKVMYELAKGGTGGHLPFRDSLLTRLLKPSLTGSGAKIAIICNVTPASSQSDETWNTLRFADGAKRIKVAAAKNEVLDLAAVVAQYQREVAQLKAQLAALSGAAASAGGQLSPDVLQAIQASLNNSSKDNAADEAKDQAAQLQYLRECLSFASLERDQLLTMNKALTAMLVQQVSLAAGSPSGADKAAVEARPDSVLQAAEQGGDVASSSSASSDRACAAGGASGVQKARNRTAKIRRCLSYESLEYYSQWHGRKADAAKHQQQQHQQQLEEPGLECNAADAAEVQQLLRLTSDELPDFLTHDAKQRLLQQQQQQMQVHVSQPQQQQQQLGLQQEAAAGFQDTAALPPMLPVLGVATAAAAAAAPGEPASCPASSSGFTAGPLASHRSGHGVRFASDASTASAAAAGLLPPALSKYYSAVSSFGGLSTATDGSGGTASFQGTLAAAAGGGGGAGMGPLVPCPIVFPGSRRTSKTLAVAAPDSGVGGNTAGWLGFVGLPALPEGVRSSALSEVVEAHRALAAQRSKLELLQQQLADKEALLEQARQLQQGQVLQLRLTITAADRALLRDKLAEAEQQIAGYKAQQSEYEQDFTELFDHMQKLQTASEQIQQERDALAAQLAASTRHTASPTPSNLTSADAAVGAIMASPENLPAVSISRSISRCSGGSQSECSSPEPGSSSSRIPLPPGSTLRGIATTGGINMSPPASSRIGGSMTSQSRSVGSPPRKSAAAAATFNNIKAAMLSAVGGPHSPPSSSRGGVPAQGSGSSPRLKKLASNLPAISAEGIHGVPVQLLHPQGSDGITISSLRPSRSPGASPLSVSRNNSFLSQRSGPSVAHLNSNSVTAGAAAAGHGALSASFSGPSPSKEGREGREGRERDSKLRASWSSGLEAQQGGFNPICITSPFHREDAGPSGSVTAAADSSGSPGNTIIASPDAKRTGGALLSQQMSLLQQGKQSRIPLPPFLKRHSKRMLQQQQQGGSGDCSGDSGSGAAAPVLDKFLLALHGHHLPEDQQQLPSEQQTAAAAAAAAATTVSFRPAAAAGSLQGMTRSDSSTHTGLPRGLPQKASPFATQAAAVAGIAAERMQGPLGEGVEGCLAGMEGCAGQEACSSELSSMQQQDSGLDSCGGASSCRVSVRSHPVRLSDRLSTAAWSIHESELARHVDHSQTSAPL